MGKLDLVQKVFFLAARVKYFATRLYWTGIPVNPGNPGKRPPIASPNKRQPDSLNVNLKCACSSNPENYYFKSLALLKEEVESYLIKYGKPITIPFVRLLRN